MIDKGKGDSMTQEQELKKGQMGYKKSSDFSEKKRAGEGNLLANSRMISEQGNLCYCILTLQYIKRHSAEYMLVLVNLVAVLLQK